MRVLFTAFFVLAICGLATSASAQNNQFTTIVLHAVDISYGPCEGADDVDCDAVMPMTDITGMATPTIYMLLRNYEDVAGVQAAFQTTWTMTFGLWDCQPNTVAGTTPAMPFGETAGTIACAFDPITGGTLAVIGRMHFIAGGTGCIEIIESSFPFGTHVVAQEGEAQEVYPGNRGIVCAGTGGFDACVGEVPVEPTSWGHIKSQYQQ